MARRCGLQSLFFFLIGTRCLISVYAVSKPHIVVIMVDDMGFSDVGFRDTQMHTPNIDTMISEGVLMTSSYMNQFGTPSRAAFMTGMYPYKMGLQHLVFEPLFNNSMPTQYKILPEQLRDMGYKTHYVGKWHLGFCSAKYTPTNRGFDTFYGMYHGEAGYSTHRSQFNAYDLHYDTGPHDFSLVKEDSDKYSTYLFTNRTIQILQDHDKSQPLFLMLSYQAIQGPVQVPQNYINDFCSDIRHPGRKKHCGCGAALDEGVGQVMEALKSLGYWDDVITVLLSDNGGPTDIGSSNWPLRGGKHTLWEGGTRVVSVIQSEKHLPKAPYEWNGLMHAIDWYPTLVAAAGKNKPLPGLDGVDNWRMISENMASKRSEFIYNIDDVDDVAAIRSGQYKLHEGLSKPGSVNDWFFPPSGEDKPNVPVDRRHDEYWLYDLEADPIEKIDKSRDMPDKKQELIDKLQAAKAEMVATTSPQKMQSGLPKKHGNAWVTGFCDNQPT